MKNADENKSAFFVSRRGRQVGMHQVDLTGIDIEAVEDADKELSNLPVKDKASVKKNKSLTTKPSQQKNKWAKNKLLVIITVMVVMILPIVGAELVTAEYKAGVSGARNDMKSYVSTTVLPTQKKSTISADQLMTVANEVNDTASQMCRGGLLDNVSKLYPRAASSLAICKSSQSNYSALASGLYDLEHQVRYLERIDAIIQPVATPITDEYAVLGSQLSSWQKLSNDLKKITPPEKMKNAHTTLAAHVTAVTEAWSKLNSANNSQDATAFLDAEKVLSAKYEAVRATSAVFYRSLVEVQEKILTDYSKIK